MKELGSGNSSNKAVDRSNEILSFKNRVSSLKSRGYELLLPSEVVNLKSGNESNELLESSSCIGGSSINKTFSIFDSKQSTPSPVNNTGTKGKGFIPWGPDNKLPNLIYSLVGALPYTAAAIKYVVDLTVGLGPSYMYRFVYYEKGEVKEKMVPYEDAGILLMGRIREVRSEISMTQNSHISDRTISWEMAAGNEPEVGTLEYELSELKKAYKEWERTLPEYQSFIENNDVGLHYQKCMTDDVHMDIYFPTIGLSKGRVGEDWKPKIVRIGNLPAICSRLEEMDEKLRINYVYYAEKWRIDTTSELSNKDIVSYPTLMPENRINKLRKIVEDNKNASLRRRPLWFCSPCYYPSMQKPYYPQPAWWSIFPSKVYDYASTLITDKATARQNATMWGKMIFINNEYLRSIFDEKGADSSEEKEQIRNQIYNSVNKFLMNRENGGKAICLDMFPSPDGKSLQHAVEIVDVPTVNNSKEMKDELEEISSIIFFAIGVNPSVIGAVPGKSGSTGGTYQRELTLLKQNQLSPRQRTYLKFLTDVSSFNKWDKNGVWVIRQQVLTTLDRNKTGVENSEAY